MNKTEAAEIIALDVRVWVRKNGVALTSWLVQERMSELRHGDSRKAEAARTANYKTAYRLAVKGMN
jgi:hypothetical protein